MTRKFALPVAAVATGIVTAAMLAAPTASAAPKPVPSGKVGSSIRVHHAASDQQQRTQAALAARNGSVVLVARVATGANVRTVAAQAEAGPGSVRHIFTPLHRVSVRVPSADAGAAAARLRALPGVESVTRAAYRYVSETPNDTDYATHQASYYDAVAAPAAWARTHGSDSVKIAVVDTGVDVDHPDLAGKVTATYNAHTGGTDVTDNVGHGTFVAGVAAASTDNGAGVAGAGYDTSVIAAKVDYADANEQDGYVITADDEAAGIKWAADQGARIINISLGAVGQDPTEKAAIEYAQGKGALIVAAAGNDSNQTQNYPAAYDGVVAVGATDAAGHRAGFSNYGSWVTLAAPGVKVYSTVPRAGSTFWPNDTTYAAGDGTSFSTPIVAGEAALLLAEHSDADPTTLRQALVDSAHGYAGTGLGAGQVDFTKALDQFTPTTTPSNVTTVGTSGTVTLTATSAAEAVRFSVDGAALPLTATSGGSAQTSFTSYGYANGNHSVTAVDCTSGGTCSAASASATLSLNNDAPTLTSPVDGAQITGGFAFAADSSGGGVAFLVDGTRVAFDATAPYSVAYSGSALTEGEHTITAVQCSVSGSRCDGPESNPAVITSESLHPVLNSVSPSPFSPNGDKVRDTTTATYTLPDRETVKVSVLSSSGNVVRGPGALGTFGKGTRTWVWDGLGNSKVKLRSGTYTVVLDTSAVVNGTTVRGQVRRNVTLDVTAPTLASITGNKTTFYPVRDGYKDTFTPTTVLSEKATLYLQIRDSKKRVVNTIKTARNPGRANATWGGTTTKRKIVAAGTYAWQFIAVDTAGNRRVSSSYRVVVSAKKLVSKSAVLTKNGDAGKYYGPDCTNIYKSDYTHGVDVANFCDPSDFAIISGFFRFTLPSAVSYSNLTASAKGDTDYSPTQIAGVFSRFDRDDVDVSKILAVKTSATRTYSLGSVAASGHYSSKHVAEFAVAVDNVYTDDRYPSEFDLATVTLKVTYKVLK